MTVSRRDVQFCRKDGGFTLIEMMISMLVLTIVCGTVMKGVLDLTGLHNVIMNRTDMHAGVDQRPAANATRDDQPNSGQEAHVVCVQPARGEREVAVLVADAEVRPFEDRDRHATRPPARFASGSTGRAP